MISLIYKKIMKKFFTSTSNKKATKFWWLVIFSMIGYFTKVNSLISLVAPAYLSIIQST